MGRDRHHPIVYVRGYAGSQGAVEATVSTPYMGFNLGSTKLRQQADGSVVRHVFESPLIRLGKDHGYQDVYYRGDLYPPPGKVPERSIWIFRYYDQVSQELPDELGERPEIEVYAEQLGAFLDTVRDHVCGPAGSSDEADAERATFRVYLVAHSMGGLISRCYLQRIAPDLDDPVLVDKAFTYGTPHAGIDLKVVGNLLNRLPINNADTFSRPRMREYLGLTGDQDVRSLDGKFDPERFFCLVGTNSGDYDAALGLSRHAVGPMSDGLVRISNAYVLDSPRAFVHRSHSGDYGIVNSEDGYQNLRRFLFGDHAVRIDLDVEDVTLPPDIWDEAEEGREISASYHVEVTAKVRGARWDLHRRSVSEASAQFLTYERIKQSEPITLVTGYLLDSARVDPDEDTVGFSLDLGVVVPQYEVAGRLWFKDHYEGGYIFRDKFNLELLPGADPKLRYGRDSRTTNRTTLTVDGTKRTGGGWEFRVPVEGGDSHPRLDGTLVITTRPWNR